ncbi:MAG: GNAT family N-acetyltransferase [Planctomycetes bacterium]|nr:GNAT family N-acetyltransferase [Planctomycetota bacterium]
MDRLPPPAPDASTAGGTSRGATLDAAAAIAAHRAGWDALALEAPARLPMLGPTWVDAYARHRLDDGETLRVHVTTSGPRVVGVLPVVEAPSRLGARLRAPHDGHTRAGDLLVAADAPAADAASIVRAAFGAVPGARALTLCGVRDGSRTPAALAAARLDATVVEADDGRGSFVDVREPLAALRARLPDNFRRNVRKAGNRLAREAGVAFRFLEGAQATPDGLAAFLGVEASGWKGRAGTAIAADPRLVAFYRALAEGFHREGRLEWHRLEIGGEVAAVHFAVRWGRSLVLAKIAYDERFARLGPGNLLFERLLERETQAGRADEVNCLTDMPWHRHWAMPQAAYRRLTVVPRRALAWATVAAPAGLREAAKRVPLLRTIVRRLRGEPARPTDADGGEGSDA